ncbi:hypothetical protein ACFLTL_00635 [Chloroflexota bacterium]
MGSKYKYGYCLIADTLDCNYRCWFCYSHHFWIEESALYRAQIDPYFLTPEQLALQFKCKILNMHSQMTTTAERNKPLTMVRISGGEPLLANSHNTSEPKLSGVDYRAGIDFWASFFGCLDAHIADLKQAGVIHFCPSADWSMYPTESKFPVALQDFGVDDFTPAFKDRQHYRLQLRFDTNGLLFSDSNIAGNRGEGKLLSEYFIDSIYRLHIAGLLKNTVIRLTLSFKGASPDEFYWTAGNHSKAVAPSNNDKNFNPVEHPQYSSYINLKTAIDDKIKANNTFSDCIYLNPERGVMHQAGSRAYVFYKDAVDWDNFSSRTKIVLSPVKNEFNLITDKFIGSMIQRYINRGAEARATSGNQYVTVKKEADNDATKTSINNFLKFVDDNRHNTQFMIELYPISRSH